MENPPPVGPRKPPIPWEAGSLLLAGPRGPALDEAYLITLRGALEERPRSRLVWVSTESPALQVRKHLDGYQGARGSLWLHHQGPVPSSVRVERKGLDLLPWSPVVIDTVSRRAGLAAAPQAPGVQTLYTDYPGDFGGLTGHLEDLLKRGEPLVVAVDSLCALLSDDTADAVLRVLRTVNHRLTALGARVAYLLYTGCHEATIETSLRGLAERSLTVGKDLTLARSEV
ncbi:MAG: hypothetical protein HY558_02615 [Euryarchaeota archaeon]|nr:hypothetical protein [Euryarchaeota archaeon]